MFALLRNRNFALFWLGQTISLIGDYTLAIALPFYVLLLTGSILQTGLMFMVETIPGILFGTFAGVLVDRWGRRKTLIVCNLLQAVLLFPLLEVHSPHLVWVVYLVTLMQSLVSLFFSPAAGALVPILVEEKQLAGANALGSLSDSITRLIGPPLGGALLAFSGITNVVFIDAASFLFSALTFFLLIVPGQKMRGNKNVCTFSLIKQVRSIWREWIDGLQIVQKNSVLIAVFLVTGVTLLGQGFVNVMLVVYVKTILHGNGFVLGLMPMAQGVGALFGSFLIDRTHRLVRPGSIMAFCLGIIGTATLVFVHTPNLRLVLLMLAFIGICVVGFVVTQRTLVQSSALDSHRGRVFSILGTTSSLSLLVGMFIATLFGDRLGALIFLNWAAVLYILSGLLALVMLRHASIVTESLYVAEVESSTE